MKNAVSLLPLEYRALRARDQKLARARVIMVGMSVALSGVLVIMGGLLILQSVLLKNLQEQSDQVQTQIRGLAVYEQMANDMKMLEQKVEQTRQTDVDWVLRMTNIGAILPQDVRLESFEGQEVVRDATGVPTQMTCKLICVGTTYSDVARTMRLLQDTIAISAVVDSSDSTESGMKFSLQVVLDLEKSKIPYVTQQETPMPDAESQPQDEPKPEGETK